MLSYTSQNLTHMRSITFVMIIIVIIIIVITIIIITCSCNCIRCCCARLFCLFRFFFFIFFSYFFFIFNLIFFHTLQKHIILQRLKCSVLLDLSILPRHRFIQAPSPRLTLEFGSSASLAIRSVVPPTVDVSRLLFCISRTISSAKCLTLLPAFSSISFRFIFMIKPVYSSLSFVFVFIMQRKAPFRAGIQPFLLPCSREVHALYSDTSFSQRSAKEHENSTILAVKYFRSKSIHTGSKKTSIFLN